MLLTKSDNKTDRNQPLLHLKLSDKVFELHNKTKWHFNQHSGWRSQTNICTNEMSSESIVSEYDWLDSNKETYNISAYFLNKGK